ncbi:hypothetical protein F4808DRAFT_459465 [Astrocystis sublimbata]|nr:hypothetical protein F4808DRAFT_459465 [Astrocystis sublimbata]
MATVPAASAPPKRLSFAKVVASHPKESSNPLTVNRVAVPAMDRRAPTPVTAIHPVASTHSTATPESANMAQSIAELSISDEGIIGPGEVRGDQAPGNKGAKDAGVPLVNASANSTPSLVVNGSSSLIVESQAKIDNVASASDNVSQRADSNSETGAKAPSLDGKSITSGTTFALDEKESLRPDDSASVKAAAEDDEAFSVRSSLLATSRMGSENARMHRLRLGDMPERRPIPVLSEAQEAGLSTPQSGTSSQQPPPEQPQTLGGTTAPSDAFSSSIYGQYPDEKLLEAMKSPKDRLFLLRLEQEVINFVLSSKEPYMDLPPNNSFCRMLTHKLADYYHMTHSFEVVQGSVRIFRTPFCRVPASLASIMDNNTEEKPKTPPPAVLPKKIMRRGEDGGSGAVSTNASKATSEVGSDGKEKTIPKEKMTREEREEAYKIARERIFGNTADKPESGADTDEANGVSRASSVSAKDKSNLGKRGKTGKQRRDDSESFDSRSQYVKYFPPPQQMEWSPHFVPTNMPYNGQVPPPYQYIPPTYQNYPAAPQGYPTMMPGNGYPQYGSAPAVSITASPAPDQMLTMLQYPPQPQPQPIPSRYPSNGSLASAFGPPAQPTPQQPWQPSFNQTPPPPMSFPNRGPQTQNQPQPQSQSQPQLQPQGNTGQLGIPYAFGQLPAHANPHDPKSQHPIPGSYNRHAFNPKTQSFVPGNGMSPVQTPMGPYNIAVPPHGSPQIGSPHMGYAAFNQATPPQPYVGGGPGFGMSRQSSNQSLPPYHTPQHIPPQHPSSHIPQMPNNKAGIPPSQGPPPAPAAFGQQNFPHLPNYGNVATLPQKPPTNI